MKWKIYCQNRRITAENIQSHIPFISAFNCGTWECHMFKALAEMQELKELCHITDAEMKDLLEEPEEKKKKKTENWRKKC